MTSKEERLTNSILDKLKQLGFENNDLFSVSDIIISNISPIINCIYSIKKYCLNKACKVEIFDLLSKNENKKESIDKIIKGLREEINNLRKEILNINSEINKSMDIMCNPKNREADEKDRIIQNLQIERKAVLFPSKNSFLTKYKS